MSLLMVAVGIILLAAAASVGVILLVATVVFKQYEKHETKKIDEYIAQQKKILERLEAKNE